MKRFFYYFSVLTVVTIILGGFSFLQPKQVEAVGYLGNYLGNYSCITNSGDTSLTGLSVNPVDDDVEPGRFIIFLAWSDTDATPVTLLDFEDSSIGQDFTFDHFSDRTDGDPNIHVASKIFVTSQGQPGNSFSAFFSDTFGGAIMCYAAFSNSSTDELGLVDTFNGYAQVAGAAEASPTNARMPLMFSASLTDSINLTAGQDTNLFSTTGSGGLSVGMAYSNYQNINDTYIDYSGAGVDVDFAGVNYQLDFLVPTITINSGPTVVTNDVTILGTAADPITFGTITDVQYRINAGAYQAATADDTTFDSQSEAFTIQVNDLADGDYTYDIYAENSSGTFSNLSSGGFTIGAGPANNPVLTITQGPTSSTSSFIYVEGSVNDVDGDIIDRIYYTLDGGGDVEVLPVDGVFDESTETFIIGPLGPYPDNTEFDMFIGVENALAETDSETFLNQIIFNNSAVASCTLSNVPSPTTDQTPTHNISCTSADGVESMEYRYYNFVSGEVIAWTDIVTLVSGTYGDTTVVANVTPGVTLPEGNTSLSIIAETGTGKRHVVSPENTPIDVFIVEAIDNSSPTIKLNPILPNPITATAPFITGSCQDVNPFDTNSTVNLLQYRIDAGAWTNAPLSAAPLDNAVEYFSFQLPAQAIGLHTVDVRCADIIGNDTNVTGDNKTLNFEIIVQPDVEPEEVVIIEDFADDDLNSINETTAVWGNGYIRLKEKILWDRVNLDIAGYPSRYEFLYQDMFTSKVFGTDVWYSKRNTLHRYNTVSTATTNYTSILGGANTLTDFEYFTSGGDDYIFSSNDQDGLTLHNLTDDVDTVYDLAGFNSSDYATTAQIFRDSRAGRLGFFVAGAENVAENTTVFYVDMNNTPDNLADDTITWYSATIGIDLSQYTRVKFDPTNNIVYGYAIGEGALIKIHDNNTPTNIADDTRFEYATPSAIETLDTDQATGDIYFATQNTISNVYVLTSAGTILDDSDDVLTLLTDSNGVNQKQVTKVAFVAGPEYVGGQLFVTTSRGDMLYYNTNGSPSFSGDDTIIDLPVAEGLFPEFIGGLVVYDYNTLYANFHRSGFARIDLNRSWEDTGDAVTISIPPEVRLLVNNINLTDVLVGPLLEDEDGVQTPNTGEVGIQYFISMNDGIDYTEVSEGELATVLEEDYRLKLKISLTKIGVNSQTPIINGFTIAYAAYDEVPVLTSLDISTPVTSFNTNTNFPITVRALDQLGFPLIGLNASTSLQLKDFGSSTNVDALTPITMNFVDGVATISNAQISQGGTYKITASYLSETVDSVQLTVNQPASPPTGVTHTLSFYTDSPTIQKGDSAVLTWNTTNAVSVNLQDYGDVPVNGNLSVSPEVTTTYYITAFDSEGDTLTASLTITVIDGVGGQTPVSSALDGYEDPLVLTVPNEYIEVLLGDPVTIEWTTEGDPDSVYIDYLGRDATSSGSFQFYPDRDIVITITATRGNETITRTITIRVIDGLPNPYTPALVAASGILLTSLMTGGIAQYFSLFLGLVLFRKRRYWGVVYNASKYLPIPFVTVRVYKVTMKAKEYVAQTVTDLEGKYGIPVGIEGEYQVEFIHDGYRTEVKNLSIQQNSDIILDVGMIELNTEGMSLSSKIKIFFKENSPTIMQWLRVGMIALMLVGAYITLQVIRLSPLAINYIVLVLYIVAIVTQVIVLLSPYINVRRGKVVEISSKRPVKGAVFRILGDNQKATQGVESLSFTNDYGVLKIRIAPGKYAYQVSKPGYEANSGDMRIDESGKITETIYMTKGSGGFGS